MADAKVVALELLRLGRKLDAISDETALSIQEIVAIADAHGLSVLGNAGGIAVPGGVAGPKKSVVAQGQDSPNAQTRRLADKIQRLVAALRDRLKAEADATAEWERLRADREAKAAEVTRLEQQLAAKKAELRAAGVASGKRSNPGPDARAAMASAASAAGKARTENLPPQSVIREWARGAGLNPPDRGWLARSIVDAYQDAHS